MVKVNVGFARIAGLALALSSALLGWGVAAAQTPEALRSPENQVFQFAQSGTCSSWKDGSKTSATAYLWIPENCSQVKGLLILCSNVPEHMLVGNPAIRSVCASEGLGIVWCAPSFMNFRKDMPKEYATSVAFLQELLDGLAAQSGYAEVATAPWIPMGESGHLLMVDALVESKPERCIAGIWIKNNHLPPRNRTVPALVIYGTAQEWSQDKTDIRTKWNDVTPAYEGILKQLKASPDWPLSYVIDGTSGHFDCSERLVGYMAGYIRAAARARLPEKEGESLRPPKLADGFVADLPVPGHEAGAVSPFASVSDEGRHLPWYFDRAAAEEARSIASINWKAQTQLVGFVDDADNVLPFNFNGISNLKSVAWEADRLTFRVRTRTLDKIPSTFVGAGEPLAQTEGSPTPEWLCGPLVPLGEGRFRVTLDRTWRAGASYLGARQAGNETTRAVVQPLGVDMNSLRNATGKAQVITFDKPADVQLGSGETPSLPLIATSDSGLPVEFFVVSGPAVVERGTDVSRLSILPVPPRTKFPVSVTVAAWQWGSSDEPKFKMAEIVRQTFLILPPQGK